ncbi:MAG TPA: hypothetical protein VM364_21755 [Vicinamibacterales bacterium]|nr:hypothetical protein [Vicinamibacterales bacterium]
MALDALRAVVGVLFAGAFVVVAPVPAGSGAQGGDEYLRWSMQQAEAVGRSVYQRGRVGGIFDTRLLKTERSYNYKLAATWLTPEAIRATARVAQLRSRLSDDETRALVAEAEGIGGTVVMIEIDPREGSGVIPNDWEALLQPKGRPVAAVRGRVDPRLREVKALSGVMRRNYDYDRFWAVFPLARADGSPLIESGDSAVELVVRIIDREGRVEWAIPASLRGTTMR